LDWVGDVIGPDPVEFDVWRTIQTEANARSATIPTINATARSGPRFGRGDGGSLCM
jgi:hypothetical protein